MADAIRAFTREDLKFAVPAVKITWTGLDSDDSGSPIQVVDYPDMTVVINGTFGAGGSCTLQGSMDNSNWYALTDPQGNAITKTSAGIELVTEAPHYIRPLVTAGDGTTSINVTLLCRRVAR